MKRLLFAFLSFIPVIMFGQNTIKGVVLDSLTQEPLSSATVYINGTTQGTTTDANGQFELKDVTFPATIIFSFVGYEPQALDLVRNPGMLTINLKANAELPEIEVSGKMSKADKKDLEYFKTMFLGEDRWGKRATIKNENALIIDKSDDSSYFIRKSFRSSFVTPNIYTGYVNSHKTFDDTVKVNKTVFNAWATEPLIIDLPLLGYEVYVDLVKFTVVENKTQTHCDMLGYFYYKP
ncbi:MAG: carboxypeptidase-like regulatory domain-containing protein, partial [Bacteroidaceae bacterium]|nr:carboxypeptidase-like regulatory domain-containing protein [Bacteroidaceae bacterium]